MRPTDAHLTHRHQFVFKSARLAFPITIRRISHQGMSPKKQGAITDTFNQAISARNRNPIVKFLAACSASFSDTKSLRDHLE